MARRHGRSTVCYIDGFDITGDSNSLSPSINEEAADVACFGDVSHHNVLGLEAGAISHNGFYNDLGTTGIHAVLSARRGSVVKMGAAWGPEAQGAQGFAGSARLRTYQPASPIGGAVALTNDFGAEGGIDPITVHFPKANLTGTTTPQDHGVANSNSTRVHLQTFEVLGGTPQVVVYHGTADGAWVALGSFTAVQPATRSAELLVAAGANRWLMGSVQSGSANIWMAYRRL